MISPPSVPSIELKVNGQQRDVAAGLTVAQLLESLEVTTRHVAVELNREVVPRAEHASRTLAAGDELEIVTLVGGG
jgi:sulfur carrier protein